MNNILDKKKKLVKQKKCIDLLLFPCCFLWWLIIHFSWVYVRMLIILISNILKLDSLFISLLLKLDDYFYLYSPLMIYVGGKIVGFNISRKLSDLDNYLIIEDAINKSDTECKIVDEEEVLKVYDIVERFEKLPRDKQMEILNYIKGDLCLYDIEIRSEINELSNKYKDILQIECEDILFPDHDENRDDYTRKRKK